MSARASPPELLAAIRAPADLRALPAHRLTELAAQLRAYLIEQVARSGGHLAAGLGTVELTIALHRVFDTPTDLLVWDVGHQGYPHKVLTGRMADFERIRRRGGPSGFLRREESPYDAFGAGHSSTSISAALGMATASEHTGHGRKTVAIIGDGGMTAGLAYEALDHLGNTDADVLVVLNDNQMSISPNVGALSRYLNCGAAGDHGRFFEALGIRYAGPVDGHDLPALIAALTEQRARQGPRLLHVLTRKGCGYAPAERDPVKYHGVTPFAPQAGITGGARARTFTDVFGEWLCAMAERDRRLVAITPAMREGSGLVSFAARYPHRYFDVGIAEQHCLTFAAGLACQGLRPVVAIYSTFLQRAYDQLVHDVALQRLPVLFAIDRAGLVGPDGATHNGGYDLTCLRCIPGMTVMAPASGAELADMLYTGFELGGPAAVRYPRAAVEAAPASAPWQQLRSGSAQLLRSGRGVALLAFGTLVRTACEVAEAIDATVINMRFVKPLDMRMILEAAAQHELVVTLEENVVAGGAGSAVGECLAQNQVSVPLLAIGLPDRNIEHATREEALGDAGLDRDSILAAIERAAGRVRGARRAARRFHPASAIVRALSIGSGR